MFELLALLVVAAVGGVLVLGALFAVLAVAKFTIKLALLPLKILVFPFVAVLFLVKMVVVFAASIALVAVFAAVIIPILVLVALVAIPVTIIAAVT